MKERAICPFSLLIALCILCISGNNLHKQVKPIAFVGATIYPFPGASPIKNGVILIDSGKIRAIGGNNEVSIPPAAETINCKGLYITAAFWNSHIHLLTPDLNEAQKIPDDSLTQRLQRMLSRYGVAYAFDIGSYYDNTNNIRKRIESGNVKGPLLLTTGLPFTPQNGKPFYVPFPLPSFSSIQEVDKLVDRQIETGVGGIKIFSGSPVAPGNTILMDPDFMKEVVMKAHGQHKPVFAHPTSQEGVNRALESGVDIIAHTTPDDGKAWGKEFVQKMSQADIYLVPTMKLWKWELQRKNIPGAFIKKYTDLAKQQLSAFRIAGGTILFGTDIGYMSDYDPTDEYIYMQEAGMNLNEVLASMTTIPALKFGHANHTGILAKGMDADLVILASDPAKDIKNLNNVRTTYRNGIKIF